jgi:L-amino acid N-acyltransferase
VLIRASTVADAAEIASLLNALLTTTTIEWTVTPRTEDDVREWLRVHEVVLVVEDQSQIVGVAAFGWFRDVVKWPGYRFTVENTIHVRQDRWGSGVGEILMDALINRARASGIHTMIAAIDRANEPSIRFHERLGFTEVGRMPEVGAKFGRWLDLVLLQKTLDERTAPSGD